MIGVVAIGRNEGQRLRVCLESALREAQRVVYVDSGSTDDSVAMARAHGVEVVELDLSVPFTAARARNEGFARLMQIAPQCEFVQFVDGDCEIVGGWVARAASEMKAKPLAAIVCGRRRERFPRQTIYNKLCDIEWNSPIGKARACGGDALVRVKAFQDVRGYNVDIIAGEEPEMCVRLRQAGWEIWRIDADMTMHDAAMTHFSQWWKRSVRAGHAFAEGFARHGAPPEKHNAREVKSVIRWTLIVPAVILLTGIVLFFIAPKYAWLAAMMLLVYPLLTIKIAVLDRRTGLGMRGALLYGFFVTLGNFVQLFGMIKYWLSRARGKRSTLIEYKGASKPTSSSGVVTSATTK